MHLVSNCYSFAFQKILGMQDRQQKKTAKNKTLCDSKWLDAKISN